MHLNENGPPPPHPAAAVHLDPAGMPPGRVSGRSAQETLRSALRLLQSGELFGIYPEGTRSPDGKLYRGRTGVGWLALASGAPVIPVAMIGTDRVLPPGRSVPALHRVHIR